MPTNLSDSDLSNPSVQITEDVNVELNPFSLLGYMLNQFSDDDWTAMTNHLNTLSYRQSVTVVYATTVNGDNLSTTSSPGHKFVGFINGVWENGDPPPTESIILFPIHSVSWSDIVDRPNVSDGVNGLSAYDIWLSEGNTGTVSDFLSDISGTGISNLTVDETGKNVQITYSNGVVDDFMVSAGTDVDDIAFDASTNTVTITLNDGTPFTYPVNNGNGIYNITTNKIGGVTTITITLDDGTVEVITIQDGSDGNQGIDGEDGARTASGYVFYSTPNTYTTPSASSYNFTTGDLVGLSSGWSQIPSMTAEDGNNYYASRWTAREISYGGGQYTVVFTTPSVHTNFDGIVSFTNLQQGIEDNVTVIDGGKITTDSLTADKINAHQFSLTSTTQSSNVLNDAVWGNLYTAFLLDSTSSTNECGLIVHKQNSELGCAIYGLQEESDAAGGSAAIVGVHKGSNINVDHIGGWFKSMGSIGYGKGVVGISEGTSEHSAGGYFVNENDSAQAILTSGNVDINAGGYWPVTVNGWATIDQSGWSAKSVKISLNSFPAGNYPILYAEFFSGYSAKPGIHTGAAFYFNPGNNTAYIQGGVLPFTGVHSGVVSDSETLELGDIVVDVQVIAKEGVSNTVSEISKSTSANQKTVIGVYAGDAESPSNLIYERIDEEIKEYPEITEKDIEQEWVTDPKLGKVPVNKRDLIEKFEKKHIETRYEVREGFESKVQNTSNCNINAVGEGQINVCGENGDIEAGDLIVSSTVPGKGMKQDDDIVRNYTVAKARETISFTSSTDIAQIACVYLCG